MFPLELVTIAGGWIFGLIGKIASQRQENRKYELQIMSGNREERSEARAVTNKEFMWTRRVIALTVVFSVMVFPTIASLLYDVPVIYAYPEVTDGFLWFDGAEVTKFQMLKGVTILPFQTHAASAVIGLYFGKGK